jgi:hypothetical protein
VDCLLLIFTSEVPVTFRIVLSVKLIPGAKLLTIDLKFIRLSIILSVSIAVVTGCRDNPVADDSGPLPTENLRFSDHIQPVFHNNCSPCHVGQSTNGVRLDSYNNVIGSVGTRYGTEIVNPGNPDDSPLVDKIEPDPAFGVRMPQGRSPLGNDQIQAFRTWIEEGAMNN